MKHVEEPRRAKRGNLKSVCTDFENSINRILVTHRVILIPHSLLPPKEVVVRGR